MVLSARSTKLTGSVSLDSVSSRLGSDLWLVVDQLSIFDDLFQELVSLCDFRDESKKLCWAGFEIGCAIDTGLERPSLVFRAENGRSVVVERHTAS